MFPNGTPRPVHASQPGPAIYPPFFAVILFPSVMSLNTGDEDAYIFGCINPTFRFNF